MIDRWFDRAVRTWKQECGSARVIPLNPIRRAAVDSTNFLHLTNPFGLSDLMTGDHQLVTRMCLHVDSTP